MQTPVQIATEIANRLQDLPPADHRHLIAIAGPPGSGKSTVAAELCALLNESGRPSGLVAMDGFHLDNTILDAHGLRPRKGAPDTFDLAGFTALVDRLLVEDVVIAPRFCRNLDAAIGSAVVISKEMQLVIVEGNYLLLDEPGWRSLSDLWTTSVFLDVPLDELKKRLHQRWLTNGKSAKEASQKVENNDLLNARRVLENALPPTFKLQPA